MIGPVVWGLSVRRQWVSVEVFENTLTSLNESLSTGLIASNRLIELSLKLFVRTRFALTRGGKIAGRARHDNGYHTDFSELSPKSRSAFPLRRSAA